MNDYELLATDLVRRWRDDATENIERIDCRAATATPGRRAVDMLLRSREAQVLILAEQVLILAEQVEGAR